MFDVENSFVVVDMRIDGSVVVVVFEVAVTKFHTITTFACTIVPLKQNVEEQDMRLT